jgi:membrane protease YdiL (CAAX protease family)
MLSKQSGSLRDLVEVIFGFVLIVGILWVPEHPQRILAPIALLATLGIVLARRPSPGELGVGWRGLVPSLWILPAATLLAALSMAAAHLIGTLHPLYKGDFAHVTGYLTWTTYQQFLLQDYFMPRLERLVNQTGAVTIVAILFAVAHLPNLTLTGATLIWGAISCLLFLRYSNLYAIGLAQGLLGLCFAVCIPDALHHHLRVGLGYLRYHSAP